MYRQQAAAAALVSLCLALPAAATDGLYVSAEGGGSWVRDWNNTRTLQTLCGPRIREAVAKFDTGWAAFGAFGYGMSNWRVEVEGGYRQNDAKSFLVSRKRDWQDGEGDLTEISAVVNIIYDIPLFDRFSLSLGLGAGADYASIDVDTSFGRLDDSDWRFLYQGIAGLNYAITDMTVLFVNYRYANAADGSFDPNPNYHVEGEEFEKHAATAGVRFQLSGPEAPIVVPPPAKPQPVPLEREFIVFFGFNRADLTPQALSTIRDAVVSVRKSGSAAIRVVGHADRAGSISYNKALSVRRAQSVKKALIGEGISGQSISVSGRGESEPMVPTADGVRESQNRRVHISF